MKGRRDTPHDSLTPALEAILNLAEDDLAKVHEDGLSSAMNAHFETEHSPVTRKASLFHRHIVPWRRDLVLRLANTYRRYFKLAIVHPDKIEADPPGWACAQLQPAVVAALEWIGDWYILACDGENQYIRHEGTISFIPGQTVSLPIPLTAPPFPPLRTWRAPAWLFQLSPVFGIGPLKSEHVPANDSEEKLGAAHSRLLIKGARRIFRWELSAAIETVRNEEIAAAGAIPAQSVDKQTEESNKRKASKEPLRGKGAEGLVAKTDLSQYKHNLTDKQTLAFSLKYEHGLGLSEIALRMDLDRKTAHEHIEAANRKIAQVRSKEKAKTHRAKREPE